MKRQRIPRLVVPALVGVGLATYFGATHVGAGKDGTSLRASGTVEARNIRVGSKVGGRILEVKAREGDIVEAGQAIGTLGRTGKNAYPKRSPTHLHFSCLSFDNGKMTPYNTYTDLLRAVVEKQ